MKLNMKQMKTARTKNRPTHRRSHRSANLIEPVSQVVLTYSEEQNLYDRMFDAQVYKNGRFFGYRSQKAETWHSSAQALVESQKPISPALMQKMYRLINSQELKHKQEE